MTEGAWAIRGPMCDDVEDARLSGLCVCVQMGKYMAVRTIVNNLARAYTYIPYVHTCDHTVCTDAV